MFWRSGGVSRRLADAMQIAAHQSKCAHEAPGVDFQPQQPQLRRLVMQGGDMKMETR
jgi:hypothetical protein